MRVDRIVRERLNASDSGDLPDLSIDQGEQCGWRLRIGLDQDAETAGAQHEVAYSLESRDAVGNCVNVSFDIDLQACNASQPNCVRARHSDDADHPAFLEALDSRPRAARREADFGTQVGIAHAAITLEQRDELGIEFIEDERC